MNKTQANRLAMYQANKEELDKSAIKMIGNMTALIDDFEMLNAVFPKVFPNDVKLSINKMLNYLHKGEVDIAVAEGQNAIAQKYREFNKTLL